MDGVPAAPEPIEYSLSAAERVRLRDEWRTRQFGGNRKFLFLLPAVYLIVGFVQVCLNLERLRVRAHHGAMASDVSFVPATILLFGGVLMFAILALPSLRSERHWQTCRIVFTPAGIELTQNGAFERVAWYAVGEAYQLPLSIALSRRDDASHPIRIPRTALPDSGDALWSYLELRLTGHRPAIRDLGFTAPKRLVNVEDQFLTDRGLTA